MSDYQVWWGDYYDDYSPGYGFVNWNPDGFGARAWRAYPFLDTNGYYMVYRELVDYGSFAASCSANILSGTTLVALDDTIDYSDSVMGLVAQSVITTGSCGNKGYTTLGLVTDAHQSYDMKGAISKSTVKTYSAGGAIQEKIIPTYDADGILAKYTIVSYQDDVLIDQKVLTTYRAESRLEARPIKTQDMDGIIELGRTKTYSADLLSEGTAYKTYYAGGSVQEDIISTYQMSGLLVSDEFPPFEIPQAFNIRKPSNASEECSYPFDSRNM